MSLHDLEQYRIDLQYWLDDYSLLISEPYARISEFERLSLRLTYAKTVLEISELEALIAVYRRREMESNNDEVPDSVGVPE